MVRAHLRHLSSCEQEEVRPTLWRNVQHPSELRVENLVRSPLFLLFNLLSAALTRLRRADEPSWWDSAGALVVSSQRLLSVMCAFFMSSSHWGCGRVWYKTVGGGNTKCECLSGCIATSPRLGVTLSVRCVTCVGVLVRVLLCLFPRLRLIMQWREPFVRNLAG